MNAIGYAAYLLAAFPYSLESSGNGKYSWESAGYASGNAGRFVAGYYGVTLGAEMRFGPLDAYANPKVYGGMFLVLRWFLCLLARGTIMKASRGPLAGIFCACFLASSYFWNPFICSPCSEISTVCTPNFLFICHDKVEQWESCHWCCGFLYSCLIVFISLNQVATGAVSRSMVQEIETRGLLGDPIGSLVKEATVTFFRIG